MSEKWTKGPWYVEIGDEEDDEGVAYICHPGTCSPDTVICSFPDVIDDEVRANVYLMAAAPKLYSAIKTNCHFCEENECGECLFLEALKAARGES